jgi:hypothetical protein
MNRHNATSRLFIAFLAQIKPPQTGVLWRLL